MESYWCIIAWIVVFKSRLTVKVKKQVRLGHRHKSSEINVALPLSLYILIIVFSASVTK